MSDASPFGHKKSFRMSRNTGKEGKFRGRRQSQWDPKYGCRGTVTARFALIAFVAWKRLAASTLGKLMVHPEYGWKCP